MKLKQIISSSPSADTQRHSATKEGHMVISPSLMDTQAYVWVTLFSQILLLAVKSFKFFFS